MTIAAETIIHRVVDILQDSTSIRWPVAELVRYLNDAQREVVMYRPDSMVTNHTMTCAQGAKQSIPATGSKLIDVVKNGSTNKAVRLTNREILDAQQPGWHAITPSTGVVHYTYDPRDPKVFYVYPPATNATTLDIVYSSYPTDIVEPADGSDWDDVVGNISVPAIYANALQDFVLYKAYIKDSEYAGNAQRAQAHYAAFANALGIEIKATVGVMPSSKGNPNAAAAPVVAG